MPDGPPRSFTPGDRLEIGRVGRAHGLRGEVVVTPITNRAERFAAGSVLDVNGTPTRIVSSRPQQHRFVVRFDGVDDRDAAERLRGALLTAPPIDGGRDGDPDAGGVWAHEAIGATVLDRDGNELGPVVAIEANPAHDLLVLESGALIPVVFVVDQAPGRIVVELPEGLLDLFD
jgi:16S rRNA processing protein RimM